MRPIWSGTISFGLVSVPVQMYSATESKELRFHFLHKDDLQPIGYDKVRKDTGKHVDPDDVVRGFEIEKGKYVPIEDEDLDRLDIELTHAIDILDFSDLEEIDPIYFRKAYYLAPQDGAEKPYRLLVRALDETGKVGVAKVVIRNKQHLAALRAHDGVLVLETMYYADEVRKPESVGSKKSAKDPIFVVQRHAARSLHYDFRLERNGALASWAVPKGPPLEPGQQHLAVHVEDHPLEYATFEGEIPKGEYGGGTVEIWDKGTYELVEEKKNGGLTVRLHGERLKGTWALVPAKLSGDPKNWLILRKKDDSAPAAGAPRQYRPMLATPAEHVPTGDWLYEIKWDGYRIVATVAGANASLRTRKDQDYTKRFENVAKELVKAVKTPDCVLDGEVCALDEDGRPSFSAMQQGKPGTPIVYFVFDLLEVEGEPLVDLPLEERRKRLEKLLDKRNRTVRYSETFDDGDALFEAANQQGLEGIMAKRLGSKYLPGRRSREWLKVKGHGRQEFVIA